ncbi:MAG: hypothetical protein JWM68_111, partial [Verrucomicrobiales bacterium]|nr:hypothetical protein [Verrucomicrobiales bacterium]
MADIAAFGAGKVDVPIKHHTQEVILLDRQALLEASRLYQNSRGEVGRYRNQLELLTETAQMFVTGTRDMLKLRLGRRYSIAWAGTGFEGTLESPRTPVELLPIVERMQGFLGLHPEYEV